MLQINTIIIGGNDLKKEINFEDAMQELEQIAKELENNE